MTGVSDDEPYRKYETVNLYRRGPGAKVELNRPERLNAWSDQFSLDLLDAIQEVVGHPEIRALVVTGAGPLTAAMTGLGISRRPVMIGWYCSVSRWFTSSV